MTAPWRPVVLAHRGARRVAPENTLAAFAAARAQGADGVELDVRRTRDGVLVIHHDPAPADGPVIAEADLDRLRELRPGMPTLAEALDECEGLMVNVEIKNLPWEPGFDPEEGAAAGVVALLAARGGRDRIIVSSFHLATIDRVRALDPAIATGVLFVAGADVGLMTGVARDHGHAAIHPELACLGDDAGERIAAAHAAGLAVNVWTVNEPADVVRLAGLGADGLVTDVPDSTLAALG